MMKAVVLEPPKEPPFGPGISGQMAVGSGLSLKALDRPRWAREASSFADFNYRQFWPYSELAAERIGASSEFVGLEEAGEILALASVRVRHVPVVGGGVAYVNGGPLVRHREDRDLGVSEARLVKSVDALIRRYVRDRGLTLRVVSPVGSHEWNERQGLVLSNAGLHPGGQGRGYRTLLKTIDIDDEALRRSLHQKWRNCLNAALRNNLSVEVSDSAEALERFGRLFRGTQEREGFVVAHDAEFFRKLQQVVGPSEARLQVIIIRAGDRDAAGHLGMSLGDTSIYLLGGGNETGRRTKASYLAQWHAMIRARTAGCRLYDLGGIDPLANPGVHKFKEGLGGFDVCAAGPYELRAEGWRGRCAVAGEWLYAQVLAPMRRQCATPSGLSAR